MNLLPISLKRTHKRGIFLKFQNAIKNEKVFLQKSNQATHGPPSRCRHPAMPVSV
jgi:hypothetical protein